MRAHGDDEARAAGARPVGAGPAVQTASDALSGRSDVARRAVGTLKGRGSLVANSYLRTYSGLRLALRPMAMRFDINRVRLNIERGRRVIVGTRCRSRAKDRTGRESAEYTGGDLTTFSASAAGERGYRGADHRDAR